jgi:hypothetical protein
MNKEWEVRGMFVMATTLTLWLFFFLSLVCSIVFVKFWRDIDQQNANGFFNGEVIG